ncbi:hypothetical protein E2R62_09015 [Citrobacter rodentium]|uniref:Uncharacterized protein n=1 Tax=Citrobacter rodentium TaxID=67825 RepID=A0A482PMI9_CITRO|nr:hypothetical protein E2R62_09015 [Citrobacter rodentium]
MANEGLSIFNGFLFRFVMQIFHDVTFKTQSGKEPFTMQGYFYKMHLIYIIKDSDKGRPYA